MYGVLWGTKKSLSAVKMCEIWTSKDNINNAFKWYMFSKTNLIIDLFLNIGKTNKYDRNKNLVSWRSRFYVIKLWFKSTGQLYTEIAKILRHVGTKTNLQKKTNKQTSKQTKTTTKTTTTHCLEI